MNIFKKAFSDITPTIEFFKKKSIQTINEIKNKITDK